MEKLKQFWKYLITKQPDSGETIASALSTGIVTTAVIVLVILYILFAR